MKKGFSLLIVILAFILVTIFLFFAYSKWKQLKIKNTIGGLPAGIVLANNGKFYIFDSGLLVVCGLWGECNHNINPVLWEFDPLNSNVNAIHIPYNLNCSNGKILAFSQKISFSCDRDVVIFDTSKNTFDNNIDSLRTSNPELFYNEKPISGRQKLESIFNYEIEGNKIYEFGCYGSDSTGGRKGFMNIIDLNKNNLDQHLFDNCIQNGIVDSQTGQVYFTEVINGNEKLIKYNTGQKKEIASLDLGNQPVAHIIQDQNKVYLTTYNQTGDPRVNSLKESSYLFIVKKDNLSDDKQIDIMSLGEGVRRPYIAELNDKVYFVGITKNEPFLAIYNKDGQFLNKLNLRKELQRNH